MENSSGWGLKLRDFPIINNDVYLSLGSNMGDRENYLIEAVERISQMPLTRVRNVSKIYETKPVGYFNQSDFLNQVILIETGLLPLELLDRLQYIEIRLGRKRDLRWGPRTIDIDILLFGNMDIKSPRLTIPHPRMFERGFVLVPLRDIISDRKNVDMLGAWERITLGIDSTKGNEIDDLINKCGDKDGVVVW